MSELWRTISAGSPERGRMSNYICYLVGLFIGTILGWNLSSRFYRQDTERLDWLERTRSEIDTEGPGFVIYNSVNGEESELGHGASGGSYKRLRPAIDAAMRKAKAANVRISDGAPEVACSEWVGGWREMSSAPRDGTPILVWLGGQVWIAAWEKYNDSSYPYVWQTQTGSALVRPWKDDEEPEAWRPLPEPPTDGGERRRE